MDSKQFTAKSPGKIVEIATPRGKDCAFIPDELPPKWTFDPKLWPLLVEAKESLGTLNGIGQTLPDPHLLLTPLQNREAVASSKIEGTYVTPELLLLYEMNPVESNKPSERVADWIEVHNYGVALKEGRELLKTMPVCVRVVKQMHARLLHRVRGQSKAPGDLRQSQVQIGYGGRFMPPPANEITRLMTNLEGYINKGGDELDPLIKCFVIHYQFETIHPFLDGNGRIGRALLALMTYHWLGHSEPWLYLSPFFERFKDEYIDRLYRVSTEGAWTLWIEFCLQGTIAQAKDSVQRCNKFNSLKKQFHERVQTLSPTPRTHTVIDALFANPIIRIAKLAKILGVTYPTAKSDVELLIRAGILSELPSTRPKAHYCSEVFSTAYSEETQEVSKNDDGLQVVAK